MAKIYELTQQQQEILDLLFWLDSNDEQDQKEIEYLNKKLSEIQGSAENTIRFLSGIWLETRGIKEQRKQALQRMQKRMKSAENAEDRIKNKILEIMQTFDIKKVEADLFDVRQQYNKSSIVYDESFNVSLLPNECIRYKPAEFIPIADEVKKLIESGEEIPGVSIVKSLGVRIS